MTNYHPKDGHFQSRREAIEGIPTKSEVVIRWEGERREAFKRIYEEFEGRRKRINEQIKWHRENPHPEGKTTFYDL